MTWKPTMTAAPSKSQIQRLRRAAKKLAAEMGISHLAALHQLATDRGYADWSQVARAKNTTPAAGPAPVAANPRFASLYERAIAQLGLRNPPTQQEVVEAMQERPAKNRSASGHAVSGESLTPSTRTSSRAARRVAAIVCWSMCTVEHGAIEAAFGHVSLDMTSFYCLPLACRASRSGSAGAQ